MKVVGVASVILLVSLSWAETTDNAPAAASKSSLPSSSPASEVLVSKSTVSSTLPTSTPSAPPTPSTTPSPGSTTIAPTSSSTTSVPPASTTAKPIPKEYIWNVTDPNGVMCILAKADIKLSLAFTNESSKQEVKLDIPVPQNATSSGDCGSSSQILKIHFGTADSITFNFSENAGKYHLAEILSSVTIGDGNGTISFTLTSGHLELYNTHVNTSYGCSWSEPAILKEEDAQHNNTEASMKVTLKLMRFEAFRNSTDGTFSKEYSCPMDTPDIVPVMVGIALGILVAVVLIAYLVGRRSTQAEGYLSM